MPNLAARAALGVPVRNNRSAFESGPPSTITSGTYRRRFGDLARARRALKT
jgi:hypothetical protein